MGENQTSTKNSTNPVGKAGNYKTVEIMKGLARKYSSHPLIRELTLQILNSANVPSQDYIKEALAIGSYIQRKMRYVRDINGIETVHDPLTMLDQIKRGTAQGDCDDMSLMIATMLLSIGHQPYFRLVKYKNDQNAGFQHIYVVVYERNYSDRKPVRVVLDAILKRQPIGTEVKAPIGEEIKV